MKRKRLVSNQTVLLGNLGMFTAVFAMLGIAAVTESPHMLLATCAAGLIVIAWNIWLILRKDLLLYNWRYTRTEVEWRRKYQNDGRGYFLILRGFKDAWFVGSPTASMSPAVHNLYLGELTEQLSISLNRHGGVVVIGGPHVTNRFEGVALRPQDEHWREAVALAMRSAWAIFLVPDLSKGVGEEMRALIESEHWRKTLVVVPPELAESGQRRWNTNLAKYRDLGFALPPSAPHGYVYFPNKDFSIAIGQQGPRVFGFTDTSAVEDVIDAVVAELGPPHFALHEVLPSLLSCENWWRMGAPQPERAQEFERR